MQVKKFEATSMKEALKLIKNDFGPDAIVLATKEKKGGYGKKDAFEVTAAISNHLLQKKKLAELKLNQKNKEKFSKSSAKSQKKFIEEVFSGFQSKDKKRETTQIPYILINDQGVQKDEESEEKNKEGVQIKGDRIQAPLSLSAQSKKKEEEGSNVRTLKYPPFSLIKRRFGSAQKLEDFEEKKKKNLLSTKVSSSSIDSIEKEVPRFKSRAFSEDEKDSFVIKDLFSQTSVRDLHFVELNKGFKFIYEKLSGIGISDQNIVEILKSVKKELSPDHLENRNIIEASVARFFLDHIAVSSRFDKKYHFFVGVSGSGKTTTLIQLALQMIMEGKKNLAFVEIDRGKIGASERLKNFSNILGIPFFKAKDVQDLERIRLEKLQKIEFVLIDLFSLDFGSKDSLSQIIDCFPESFKKIHYVESLLFDEKESSDFLKRIQFPFDDLNFTHLDQSKSYGRIYNFQKLFSVPLHSFSFGEEMPEDFEMATKERFVDLVFQMVDWGKREKDLKKE